MLDSTVVCRRALGCEWGGAKVQHGAGTQGIGVKNTLMATHERAPKTDGAQE